MKCTRALMACTSAFFLFSPLSSIGQVLPTETAVPVVAPTSTQADIGADVSSQTTTASNDVNPGDGQVIRIGSSTTCKYGTPVTPVAEFPCQSTSVQGGLAPAVRRGIQPGSGYCQVTGVTNGQPSGFHCYCEMPDSYVCYTVDDSASARLKTACAAANPPLTIGDFNPPDIIPLDDGVGTVGTPSNAGLCSIYVHNDEQNSITISAPISSPAAIQYALEKWQAQYPGMPASVGQAIWGGCEMLQMDPDAVQKFITDNYCAFIQPQFILGGPVVTTDVQCCAKASDSSVPSPL
jgi:hypothetical protein